MINFKNFVKSYSNHTVLAINELNIPTGIHWVKGANGSGKTTLFKSLAGLLPYEGDIILDHHISAKKNPIPFRRLINYSEAEPIYPTFLTAKDLIRFIGKTKESDITQQDELINHFGIQDFLNKSCQTYSSGMLKKVSLALAFLGKPRLVILDEPLITLDEDARNLLFDLICRKVTNSGTNFLISSHQSMSHSSIKINNTYRVENKSIICT